MKLQMKLEADNEATLETEIYADNLAELHRYARLTILTFWRQDGARKLEEIRRQDEERSRREHDMRRMNDIRDAVRKHVTTGTPENEV